MKAIDALSVNSIRVLAADAIQKANSGHPGLPLGSAPMAYELWANHMNHNPANPKWENRDRFILSGGHGSMLLYSLLHLFGYGLTKEDIMNFRQLGSLTPGHPEYGHTVGVEATTGPLGAGMGMAVGMALAEKHLAAVFNKENYPVVDHYTYVLGGDGCMMEGISSEAFSLAGTMGLSKLIVLYDSNRISIEGSTDLAFRENVEERMKAFGFQTITVEDGTNLDAIGLAIEAAKAEGINAIGPIPPDSVFSEALGGWYDIVVCMYHDQGHIPLKTVGFVYDRELQAWKAVEGVNVTLGLPIIRTSVDHGTGFALAGKGTSNELSLVNAIDYAVRMAKGRN